MPAIKLNKFLGAAPKISPELLPDASAQIASNVKMYSGDLLPYRIPTVVGNVQRNGEVKTIYPMRNPDNPLENKWLSWLTDVDVATTTSLSDQEQRIYYTGDGVPKVTNYDAAVDDGTGPYPINYYDLGLPLPVTVPVATAASFTGKTTASYARDAGNIATITTSTAHEFKTGQYVTVSGFTSTEGKTFNITNARVTVTGPDTFTYFSSGTAVTTTADSAGSADLAGTTVTRNYVFTWITPWGEESIPSNPSDTLYVKEGQVVTVGNLPTAKPTGNNFIFGFRLYRNITSNSGSDYFRVKTVVFPQPVATISRETNSVTMTIGGFGHHNLLVGDKIKVSGVSVDAVPDTSFDVVDALVTEIVDDATFKYIATGPDVAEATVDGGTLYWDTTEVETDASRYYEDNTFIDDYDPDGLASLLDSLDNDAPDADMQGIITAQNNVMVGFVNNELCFSEPGKPWAWPIKYRLVFDSPIVAISPIAGSILVLTTRFPHLVSGSTPATMSSARVDAPYPCTSKRGVVNIGYGVVFPTFGGLGVFSPSAGIDLVTKLVHDWDTWAEELDPTSLTAAFYAGKYFASHSAGAFIFEREDKVGGFFVNVPIRFTAGYYDSKYNRFYYISDASGTLSEWDAVGQALQPLEWKSKVIVTKEYMNLGAARVVGDYSAPSTETDAIIAYNDTVPGLNEAVWAVLDEMGTINGPKSYIDPDTSARVDLSGALNSYQINGDPVTYNLRPISGEYPVTFTVWANKKQVCSVTVRDSEIFRLPSGYRTDTFEVSVAGSARIRAIHIGETPFGLRTA
jgi:hypothetical protein